MQPLAPRQNEVYQAIRDHWREVRRAPSFKELQARLNMSGTPLKRHLEILIARGYLAPRQKRKSRDVYLAETVGEAA